MIGVLMGVMDAAIVYVAIPSISGNLGATADEAVWIATGYTLGMMTVMPLNGWLTNRLGQKWYYIAAFGLFTVMSFLCGTANGIWELIVFRALQGVGGGALQPIALSILLRAAPADRRGDMIAAFSFTSIAPFALGPVLGGYFLDNYDWRLLFYFKLPICVLGIVLALVVLGEDDQPPAASAGSGAASYCGGAASSTSCLARTARGLVRFAADRRADRHRSRIDDYFICRKCARTGSSTSASRTPSFAIGCFITVIMDSPVGINLVTPLFFQGPLHLPAYDTAPLLKPIIRPR